MVFDLKALRPSVITPIRILGLYNYILPIAKGWVVLDHKAHRPSVITPIRVLALDYFLNDSSIPCCRNPSKPTTPLGRCWQMPNTIIVV